MLISCEVVVREKGGMMKTRDVVRVGDEVFCGPCGYGIVEVLSRSGGELAVRFPSGVLMWVPLECLCGHSVSISKRFIPQAVGQRN